MAPGFWGVFVGRVGSVYGDVALVGAGGPLYFAARRTRPGRCLLGVHAVRLVVGAGGGRLWGAGFAFRPGGLRWWRGLIGGVRDGARRLVWLVGGLDVGFFFEV